MQSSAIEPSKEDISTREKQVEKQETVVEGNGKGNSIRNEHDSCDENGEENNDKNESLEEFLPKDTNGLIYHVKKWIGG